MKDYSSPSSVDESLSPSALEARQTTPPVEFDFHPLKGAVVSIRLSTNDFSKYEVFIVKDGKEVPEPFLQFFWDDMQEQHHIKGDLSTIGTEDSLMIYMQQLPQNIYGDDDLPIFAVQFPELRYRYIYVTMWGGVSQWFFDHVHGSIDVDLLWINGITYYKHHFFPEALVSVSHTIYSILGAFLSVDSFLEVIHHCFCGCSECRRLKTGEPFSFTFHLNNDGIDPSPEYGKYIQFTVCGDLKVVDFFNILWSKAEYLVGSDENMFLRHIKTDPKHPGGYIYGDSYYYDGQDAKAKIRDLSCFSDGSRYAPLAVGPVMRFKLKFNSNTHASLTGKRNIKEFGDKSTAGGERLMVRLRFNSKPKFPAAVVKSVKGPKIQKVEELRSGGDKESGAQEAAGLESQRVKKIKGGQGMRFKTQITKTKSQRIKSRRVKREG